MSDKTDIAPIPAEAASQALPFLHVRRRKRELLDELSGHASLEQVLARWPNDPSGDADVASVLFTDFQQRRSRGDQASLADYHERFPEHKDSLNELVRHHDILRSLGAASAGSTHMLRLPNVGDELFGFRLRSELGRGAFARVFLAEQGELAGRPVVLKVSAASGDEPQTLAQLQHTNIVPIYSVHEDAEAGVRAVCMPYFGGASLTQVLQQLRARVPNPTSGRELAGALRAVDSKTAAELPFASMSFIEAAAWIVARLAEGLQHAHDRGVLHRDIKPSNVLLAGDGQPLLLDFNLAEDLKDEGARATVGGTVAYMAPEHLRALAARDPVLARKVDRRSDIYSLGMVLFEMLAGESPFDQSGSYAPLPAVIEAMALERGRAAPSLRRCRPDVPWGLESIVRKCLAPDPEQRYQRAEDLADDLRRFLTDQPLKHAPELSRAECLRKWARRHPRLTSSGSVATAAAVLLVSVFGALLGARGRLAQARDDLAIAQAQDQARDFEGRALRAMRLANTRDDLRAPAPEGPDVLRDALAVYEVLDRDDWQDRPGWQRLDAPTRRRLAEYTRELLLLLAWAQTRGTTERQRVGEALALLERAASVRGLGPSPALALERAHYLAALGDEAGAAAARDEAQRTPPASARDHYLVALARARADRPADAIASLDQALRHDARHYWSWALRGLCHQQLGEHVLAVADFSVCLGQAAEGWVHLCRGYSLYVTGYRDGAVRDYTDALALDPGLDQARWNRGVALLELKRYEEALADFQAARQAGRDDALAALNEGIALEGLGRTADADAAFAVALARLSRESREVQNLVRCRYGNAVLTRRPAEAAEAFAAVLADDPSDVVALYGRAALLVAQGKAADGLAHFDRAIELRPDFLDARRFRAVLLARLGRSEEAGRDINFCLAKEPTSGLTLYSAACVLALCARGDEQLQTQALDFLEKAFAQGHGRDRAASDDDLAGLRSLPRFRRLLGQE